MEFRLPAITTLSFPVNSGNGAQQCLAVTIIDDTVPDGDKSFTVSLMNPMGGGSMLGTPSTTTVTITDNGTVHNNYIRQFSQ